MSRDIGATNVTHVDGSGFHDVWLAMLEFDTPAYIHSGVGPITYDGNTYIGIGDLTIIEGIEESEELTPAPFRIGMSGLQPDWVTEALDAGNYGDVITIYRGYRGDDGTLIADPWLERRGTFEYATVVLGDKNEIVITVQHELAKLADKSGRRYSDEQARQDYSAETGFSFVTDAIGKSLIWGGQPVDTGRRGGGDDIPPGRK